MDMPDIRSLYQELIIDHGRHPRNFGDLPEHNCMHMGHNPLCGDKLILYVKVDENDVIEAVRFKGEGCAISVASASLMTEFLIGKSRAEAQTLFDQMQSLLVNGSQDPTLYESLGKLSALRGVADYPMRVKCATLAWHTLVAALSDTENPVSTE